MNYADAETIFGKRRCVARGRDFLGWFNVGAATAKDQGNAKQVFSEKLPNVPGKSLTAVVVNYVPGGKSPKHQHAGSVFAYVLSGQFDQKAL
jgi:hypothetical protein